ncbi:MAG: sulfotransferase family 2 domain-containing protein [Paracoccaceae bacterium]
MILSSGRSYIFIHIPKTGGTSLALALEARAKADDIMLGDTPKARRRRKRVRDMPSRGRLWKHSTLADVEGLIPDAEMRGLFAFTLVRNPWDRAVSYYHWLKEQSFDHPSVEFARKVGFPEFVSDTSVLRSLRESPARSYMSHANGDEQCGAYIRLEHFHYDAAPLFKHLGFTLSLNQVNASQRQADYRSYYTDQTAQNIAECCAEDIARFGYSF